MTVDHVWTKYPDVFVKYTTVYNHLIETVKYILIISTASNVLVRCRANKSVAGLITSCTHTCTGYDMRLRYAGSSSRYSRYRDTDCQAIMGS